MSQQRPERPVSPRALEPHSRVTRSATTGQTQPRQLPRYKVILLRDSTNDLMFIVRTVMELTRFCRAEATHKMWEAHHCGSSTLLTTYRERGELFVEQFAEKGLQLKLEPK